jgi:hypothetical protein
MDMVKRHAEELLSSVLNNPNVTAETIGVSRQGGRRRQWRARAVQGPPPHAAGWVLAWVTAPALQNLTEEDKAVLRKRMDVADKVIARIEKHHQNEEGQITFEGKLGMESLVHALCTMLQSRRIVSRGRRHGSDHWAPKCGAPTTKEASCFAEYQELLAALTDPTTMEQHKASHPELFQVS